MKRFVLPLVLLATCLLTAPASAQTPVGVTTSSGVSFTDAGNTATMLDGTPLISRYEIHFLPGTGCAAVPNVNLGKPTPDASGVMTAKPVPAFGTITANCAYTLLIAAIGPGGEGDSPASVPFALLQAPAPVAPAKPSLLP